MKNKCLCGCGEFVNEGKKYIQHHLARMYKRDGRTDNIQFLHKNWKGHTVVASYLDHPMILVHAPQNKNANSSGRVSQQRLLVEKKLGRELDYNERVVRKNPLKLDFVYESDLLDLYVRTKRIIWKNRNNGEYHFELNENNEIVIVEYIRKKHGYNELIKLKEYI